MNTETVTDEARAILIELLSDELRDRGEPPVSEVPAKLKELVALGATCLQNLRDRGKPECEIRGMVRHQLRGRSLFRSYMRKFGEPVSRYSRPVRTSSGRPASTTVPADHFMELLRNA